jgi:hypothetical protein
MRDFHFADSSMIDWRDRAFSRSAPVIAQEAGMKADCRSAYHPCQGSFRAGRGEARRSASPLKGLPGKN